jgi:predicted site-specific integrase-resolvase
MKNNQNILTQFISMREATKLTGINPQTLRVLADQNKVKFYKTASGQRKFDKNFLEQMCNNPINTKESEAVAVLPKKEEFVLSDKISHEEDDNRMNIIYIRVSSHIPTQNINSQISHIKSIDSKYENYQVLIDTSDTFEISLDNKGIFKIIELCINKKIGDVIIAHKDRLGIFYYDLIKYIIENSGGNLILLDNIKYKYSDKELLTLLYAGTYNLLLSNNNIYQQIST